MSKTLFTVILDFEGLNSVSQFAEVDPERSLRQWRKKLDNPAEYGLRPDRANALAQALDKAWNDHIEMDRMLKKRGPFLKAINGVTNVWCVWLSVGKAPALINIIATLGEVVSLK